VRVKIALFGVSHNPNLFGIQTNNKPLLVLASFELFELLVIQIDDPFIAAITDDLGAFQNKEGFHGLPYTGVQMGCCR
jgi:hypothetical protein